MCFIKPVVYRASVVLIELKFMQLTLTTTRNVKGRVVTNLKRVVEDSQGTTNDDGPTMWSIIVDEIVTEMQLRYKTETNEILGICANNWNMDRMKTRYTLQQNHGFFLCHQWVLMITMINHFFPF